MTNGRGGVMVSILALIIAVVALIIAADPISLKKNRYSTTTSTAPYTDLALNQEILEARLRLLALRAEVETKQNIGDAQKELTEIEQNLKKAFNEAKQESSASYQDITSDIDELQMQLRDKSAEATNTLNRLLERLRQEIKK